MLYVLFFYYSRPHNHQGFSIEPMGIILDVIILVAEKNPSARKEKELLEYLHASTNHALP